MKKLLLIFTLILNIQMSYSQSANSWLAIGSDWHSSVWYFNANYPTGFNHYYYAQDTVINGKTFQQVKTEQQLRTTDNNGNHILGDTVVFPSKHFYTSNDTVYILNSNNSLQFAWFNNPVVGDIWDFGLQYNFTISNYNHAYSQVDSIKFVTINGENLKEIYAHSCKDTAGTPVQLGDSALFVNHVSCINTKFGPRYGFSGINTFESAQNTDGYIADILICFESSVFLFYQAGNTDCNNGILTSGAIELNDDHKTLLFPNPANETISLKNMLRNSIITITNIAGQTILQTRLNPNNQINISHLTSGIYFIQVQTKYKIQTAKFIKE